MKSLFTVVLLVVVIAAFAQSPEHKVNSQIKEVTVFLQGAQVTRTATVDVKPGASTLILSGTSPHVQENSIQAEANMGLKIVGVSFRVNYLKDLKGPDEAERLQKDLERTLDLLYQARSEKRIYDEEETMLKANQVIGGEKGVDINELKIAVDYFRQRMMDIRTHRLQIQALIESYEKEEARIKAAQLGIKAPVAARPEGQIVVKVESKSEVNAQLKVSYVVSEASWFPTYDIRAKDIQSPIAITYKANISQQSGEDWENVKFTVSSANPTNTGSRPDLNPWYLGFDNDVERNSSRSITTGMIHGQIHDTDGNAIPGVNVTVKGTSIGTSTDSEGFYSIPMTPNKQILTVSFIGMESQEIIVDRQELVNITLYPDVNQLNEVAVSGYTKKGPREITGSIQQSLQGRVSGFSVSSSRQPKIKQIIAATPVVRSTDLEFTIENPFTILSGGQNQSVDMIEYEIPADYQYYSAPKLGNDAFLTARMTEWDNYNFLEGQASIFFEGKYIGKTILDTQNTSDTLTLSLGRDKNVVVTREKKREYSSDQFVGSNRKSTFAYEISVRNKKAYSISIRIEDQLPVPNTKDISVDDIEDSNAIKDPEEGLLTWNLKVEPGKTEKIDLKYEIKYPKYQNIILE